MSTVGKQACCKGVATQGYKVVSSKLSSGQGEFPYRL